MGTRIIHPFARARTALAHHGAGRRPVGPRDAQRQAEQVDRSRPDRGQGEPLDDADAAAEQRLVGLAAAGAEAAD
jgi:hypothetical protein